MIQHPYKNNPYNHEVDTIDYKCCSLINSVKNEHIQKKC